VLWTSCFFTNKVVSGQFTKAYEGSGGAAQLRLKCGTGWVCITEVYFVACGKPGSVGNKLEERKTKDSHHACHVIK
jgi:hypothetical protein